MNRRLYLFVHIHNYSVYSRMSTLKDLSSALGFEPRRLMTGDYVSRVFPFHHTDFFEIIKIALNSAKFKNLLTIRQLLIELPSYFRLFLGFILLNSSFINTLLDYRKLHLKYYNLYYQLMACLFS